NTQLAQQVCFPRSPEMQKHPAATAREASLPAVYWKTGPGHLWCFDSSLSSITSLGCEPLSGVNFIRNQELQDFLDDGLVNCSVGRTSGTSLPGEERCERPSRLPGDLLRLQENPWLTSEHCAEKNNHTGWQNKRLFLSFLSMSLSPSC
ncbi:hypothetical protein MC885_021355, partial [Smutsia gigantea]